MPRLLLSENHGFCDQAKNENAYLIIQARLTIASLLMQTLAI